MVRTFGPLPILFLGLSILKSGEWPSVWKEHWIVAMYQKKAVYNPLNYRGVHLTAQLSKVMERFLQPVCRPALMSEINIGANEFPYCPGRGSRDALAFHVVSWLLAFREKDQIALYVSDVSAAFDRVLKQRLLAKLAARGTP